MTPELIKLLSEPEHNQELSDLLNQCKDWLKISRGEMSKYYDQWDRADQVYRGEITPDEADRKAAKRKEPVKMVVPLTYQQVQTFVSFCYSVYNQRRYFFELEPMGLEDVPTAKIGQALLQRDLDYNRFRSEKVVQLLTDIGRFGLGVTKESWVREQVPVIEDVPDPAYQPDPTQPQMAPPMVKQVTLTDKYVGNKVNVVSPYRFFPDPRIPLTRFQEGEFCASEDEYSRGELEVMQEEGMLAGLEHVRQFHQDADGAARRLVWIKPNDPTSISDSNPRYFLISEIQCRLNPSKVMIAPGVALDPDVTREMKYVIWIANDNRIVRIEPCGYAHEEFSYAVGVFLPDQHRFLNFGLAELLGPLQDHVSWFINARVSSVRKVISNTLLVDPAAIEMEDLKNRSPVIRLRKEYQGTGVERFVKQLDIQDVTAGHLADVNFLTQYARESTGITENILGQFATGRRSAQEARQVSANAASRLLLTAHGIWESCLAPLGRRMLSNHRQGLDVPTMVKVLGQSIVMTNPMGIQQFKQVTKADLTGSVDFKVFDGTLPSQRGATAMVLKEILMTLMKAPQAVFVLGKDPKLIFEKLLELSDIDNHEQYNLSPQRAQDLMLMAGLGGNPGNAQGTPPDQGDNGGGDS
jgi:hypothetical protein